MRHNTGNDVRSGGSIPIVLTWLLTGLLILAQAPSGTVAAQGTKKAPAVPGKQVTPAKQRAPLTKADVQKLWLPNNAELLLNEMRLRGLGFEPDEAWLASLGNPDGMAAAVAELQKAIPPAPDPGEVEAAAPDLLARLKAAAQARNDEALRTLVHADLFANKALVYDLFDTTSYRDHVLGRFTAREARQVGVQFFQLTTSQVERLHYVLFSMSRGKIVVRSIQTGPEVARQYLADEIRLAESKLDLAFRALNDGDQAGLRNLVTPGLFEHLTELAGGGRLTRGTPLTVAGIKPRITVPMDQKSIRPVARINFTSPSGRPIQFDVDFERVNNDLRIVRIRDIHNKVIAWDPDIDNYLNRRYGLPDGPRPIEPPQGMTDLLQFQPLRRIRELVQNSLYGGDVQKLGEYAQELVESLPASGEGYGVRAAQYHMMGKWDEARRDAITALEKDGMVYFSVLHHKLFNNTEFWPVILGVSRDKILYIPLQANTAAQAEEIDVPTVQANIEAGNRFLKPRPFLSLKFRKGKDSKEYNFGAYGTTCPPQTVRSPVRLETWAGRTVCPNNMPLLVRGDWQRNLLIVQQTIEDAVKPPRQRK